MRILCIDTEPETVDYLRSTPIEGVSSLEVRTAEIGYRTGQRTFLEIPHEFDLIVCDLRRPACFDKSRRGPGQNDNYHVTLVPFESVGGDVIARPIHQYSHELRYEPKFQLIHEGQIEKPHGVASTGPAEVLRAVEKGGVPALLFMNPEWLYRSVGQFPNFFGVEWGVKRTKATLFQKSDMLRATLGEIGTAIPLQEPLLYCVNSGPSLEATLAFLSPQPELISTALLTNAVGEVFSQYTRCGAGSFWLLPPTANNAEVARLAAERLSLLKPPIRQAEPTDVEEDVVRAAEMTTTHNADEHDVFISHASEDKDQFARPLALALRKHGVRVWYDEFTLTIGDSLRANIDRGLSSSRYGIVVLSRAFFAKRWPQAELDGMVSVEHSRPGKYILPIWHDVGEEDVKHFSPMLAGKLAARSIDGLETVVRELLEVIKPDV